MSSSHTLIELVVVLGTSALVTVVFQALRLPVVLGYVLAGLLIGPHVPVPLVADISMVHVLSELGVILLMFTIGLELPLASIARVGLAGALTAVFEVGLVVTVGMVVAGLLGFDSTTALVIGACLGISSTMLVAKAFDELGWKGGFTEVVFAILVFEDLIAVALLAIVTAVATGTGLDGAALALLLAKLVGFLVLVLVGGLLIIPRVIRWIAERARRETLLISSLLVCFGMSALADGAGYSVALGAFLGGVLVAESGQGEKVLDLVKEFRDLFATIFFVSVGMSIEPALLASEAPRIAVFALVVLLLKPLGVASGVFLAGRGVRPAIQSGLSLAQIGELSFVIAGISGDPRLLAIAVGVSVVTTLVSPLLIRNSERISARVAHGLPQRFATFVSFYESWLEQSRTREVSAWHRHRRAILAIILDGGALVAVVIAGVSLAPRALGSLAVASRVKIAIEIGAIGIVCLPFALDLARRIATLSKLLATQIIPDQSKLDLGHAPRRALVVTFELAITLAVVVPMVATIQPFVRASLGVLVVVTLVLIVLARRSLREFDGHVRASSLALAELLAQPNADPAVPAVETILPGFAGTTTFAIAAGSPAVGRTLRELDLRARTGATVLAILRDGAGVPTPSPDEVLRLADVLVLAGSEQAIAAVSRQLAS